MSETKPTLIYSVSNTSRDHGEMPITTRLNNPGLSLYFHNILPTRITPILTVSRNRLYNSFETD